MFPIPKRVYKIIRCVWVRIVSKMQRHATNLRMLWATFRQMSQAG